MTSLHTPLEADIIWGSMVWSLRYLYGQEKVEEFLGEYSGTPPLILSDGFPSGYLPGPLIDINSRNLEETIKNSISKNLSFERALELLRKTVFATLLPIAFVKDILSDRNSLLNTGKKMLNCTLCPALILPVKKLKKKKKELKHIINKVCTEENCFYLTGNSEKDCKNIIENISDKTENIYPIIDYDSIKNTGEWDIYILTSMEQEKVIELLTFTGINGYGKDCSRGKGTFTVKAFEEIKEKERLDKFNGQEDGFMTISSSYIPLPGEIEKTEMARYKLTIKIGKLGGHWSSMKNFHKYPLIMCKAGSIFPASPNVKKFWGQSVKKVHPEIKEVVQYGWAFPVWGNFFEKR